MKAFLRSEAGGVAILFALMAVLLIGAAGLAIDYARLTQQRQALQEAADSGALAGAVELGLGGSGVVDRARSKAERMTRANQTSDIAGATPAATVNQTEQTVTIDVSMPARKTLSGVLIAQSAIAAASATARVMDKVIVCIYALNPSAASSLNGNGSAEVQGTNCAIQVNSDDSRALRNSGTISASHICVVGGYEGSGYSPTPETGCAPVADPFAGIAIPDPSGCTSTNFTTSASRAIGPGVYCGGLSVAGGATLTLAPGEYHIVDGALKVTSGASLVGDGVVFILSGTASMDIAGSGRVTTTPPLTGVMAGFSVVQHPTAASGQVSKITGEGRFEFPGIIYLPRQALEIAGRASGNTYVPTYAAVVADTIKISGQGELKATADTANLGMRAAAGLTVVNVRLIR